jgi:hypothetical protein
VAELELDEGQTSEEGKTRTVTGGALGRPCGPVESSRSPQALFHWIRRE